MASRRAQRQHAFALSVLGHAAVVIALTFSLPLAGRRMTEVGSDIVPIETVMIDTAALEAEMARIDAEEQAEIQRRQETEARQRREQEERQREQDRARREREQEAARIEAEQKAVEAARLAEQRKAAEEAKLKAAEEARIAREAEAARIAAEQRAAEEARREAERQAAEAARLAAERAAEQERLRREAEEAARRREVQSEIDRAIAAEQEARAARDSGLREQWALMIGRKITLYWNRPPNVDPNLECVLIVTQLPDGTVRDVTVERCTTSDSTIIRSVENAVMNASPLPQRPRGVEFERQVRITFVPTD